MLNRRGVLGGALARQRRHILLSTGMVTGHQAGEALVPFLIGVIIDTAVDGGVGDLVLWLGVLAAVYVSLSYSYRYGERHSERASEQAAHDLRLKITARVLHDRGGAEAGRLPGALVSIATSDCSRVGGVAVAVTYGTAALAGLALATVLLLAISVPLGLLVLLGTPPMLWLTHLLGKPLETRGEIEQEHAARASGIAADLVDGLRVVKGLRAEDAAWTRYTHRSREALTATVRSARAEAAYRGVMLGLSGLFLAVIAVTGGILAARGDITVGQLVSSLGLAQFLVGPMSTFGWVGAALAQGRASARRIRAVLDAPYATPDGHDPPAAPVRGEVTVRGVALTGRGCGTGLRGTVGFEATAGELLGVVTTDPGDAAALVALLARYTDPATGAVTLDGAALTTLDPGGVRAAMLVAAHHTDLFEGSVLANIRPGAGAGAGAGAGPGDEPDAGDAAGAARFGSVLAAAAADEVAGTLPDGLDTVLDEQARTLSGGQRQRIALARALAADTAVLVLHDPTTAVDAVTEARIADGIRTVRAGRTTILITTSPALLAATDRVVFVHEATVRATGRHNELLDTDEAYRAAVLA